MSSRPTLAAIRRPSDSVVHPESQLLPNKFPPVNAQAQAAVPVPREINVYSACKMPLSMSESVRRIAHARHISNSDVIRYFIAEGLRSPFATDILGK
jgi:hypothetical protein